MPHQLNQGRPFSILCWRCWRGVRFFDAAVAADFLASLEVGVDVGAAFAVVVGMAVPKELDVVRSCAGEGCLQRRVTLLVR